MSNINSNTDNSWSQDILPLDNQSRQMFLEEDNDNSYFLTYRTDSTPVIPVMTYISSISETPSLDGSLQSNIAMRQRYEPMGSERDSDQDVSATANANKFAVPDIPSSNFPDSLSQRVDRLLRNLEFSGSSTEAVDSSQSRSRPQSAPNMDQNQRFSSMFHPKSKSELTEMQVDSDDVFQSVQFSGRNLNQIENVFVGDNLQEQRRETCGAESPPSPSRFAFFNSVSNPKMTTLNSNIENPANSYMQRDQLPHISGDSSTNSVLQSLVTSKATKSQSCRNLPISSPSGQKTRTQSSSSAVHSVPNLPQKIFFGMNSAQNLSPRYEPFDREAERSWSEITVKAEAFSKPHGNISRKTSANSPTNPDISTLEPNSGICRRMPKVSLRPKDRAMSDADSQFDLLGHHLFTQTDHETPPLSASSIASSRRLEWDSGADIGYNVVDLKGNLKTISDLHRSEPEGLALINESSNVYVTPPSQLPDSNLQSLETQDLIELNSTPTSPSCSDSYKSVISCSNKDTHLHSELLEGIKALDISARSHKNMSCPDLTDLGYLEGSLRLKVPRFFKVSDKTDGQKRQGSGGKDRMQVKSSKNNNRFNQEDIIGFEQKGFEAERKNGSSRAQKTASEQNLMLEDPNASYVPHQHVQYQFLDADALINTNYVTRLSEIPVNSQIPPHPMFVLSNDTSMAAIHNAQRSIGTNKQAEEIKPHIRWYPCTSTPITQDIKDVSTQTAMSFLAQKSPILQSKPSSLSPRSVIDPPSSKVSERYNHIFECLDDVPLKHVSSMPITGSTSKQRHVVLRETESCPALLNTQNVDADFGTKQLKFNNEKLRNQILQLYPQDLARKSKIQPHEENITQQSYASENLGFTTVEDMHAAGDSDFDIRRAEIFNQMERREGVGQCHTHPDKQTTSVSSTSKDVADNHVTLFGYATDFADRSIKLPHSDAVDEAMTNNDESRKLVSPLVTDGIRRNSVSELISNFEQHKSGSSHDSIMHPSKADNILDIQSSIPRSDFGNIQQLINSQISVTSSNSRSNFRFLPHQEISFKNVHGGKDMLNFRQHGSNCSGNLQIPQKSDELKSNISLASNNQQQIKHSVADEFYAQLREPLIPDLPAPSINQSQHFLPNFKPIATQNKSIMEMRPNYDSNDIVDYSLHKRLSTKSDDYLSTFDKRLYESVGVQVPDISVKAQKCCFCNKTKESLFCPCLRTDMFRTNLNRTLEKKVDLLKSNDQSGVSFCVFSKGCHCCCHKSLQEAFNFHRSEVIDRIEARKNFIKMESKKDIFEKVYKADVQNKRPHTAPKSKTENRKDLFRSSGQKKNQKKYELPSVTAVKQRERQKILHNYNRITAKVYSQRLKSETLKGNVSHRRHDNLICF